MAKRREGSGAPSGTRHLDRVVADRSLSARPARNGRQSGGNFPSRGDSSLHSPIRFPSSLAGARGAERFHTNHLAASRSESARAWAPGRLRFTGRICAGDDVVPAAVVRPGSSSAGSVSSAKCATAKPESASCADAHAAAARLSQAPPSASGASLLLAANPGPECPAHCGGRADPLFCAEEMRSWARTPADQAPSGMRMISSRSGLEKSPGT